MSFELKLEGGYYTEEDVWVLIASEMKSPVDIYAKLMWPGGANHERPPPNPNTNHR